MDALFSIHSMFSCLLKTTYTFGLFVRVSFALTCWHLIYKVNTVVIAKVHVMCVLAGECVPSFIKLKCVCGT
jgi:hypothetical protein